MGFKLTQRGWVDDRTARFCAWFYRVSWTCVRTVPVIDLSIGLLSLALNNNTAPSESWLGQLLVSAESVSKIVVYISKPNGAFLACFYRVRRHSALVSFLLDQTASMLVASTLTCGILLSLLIHNRSCKAVRVLRSLLATSSRCDEKVLYQYIRNIRLQFWNLYTVIRLVDEAECSCESIDYPSHLHYIWMFVCSWIYHL